jgi:protein-S-isoprenylcysteine O-methyltransferase Ste14
MHFQITSISLYVFKPSKFFLYSGLTLVGISLILMVLAFVNYSMFEFLGFSKPKNSKLKTKGFNRIVRHPIYFATFILFTGFFICFPTYSTLIAVSCVISYLIIGSILEERRLTKEFGDEYIQYKREVPMLLPFLKFNH